MNAYQKIVDTALYYSNKRTNKDQRFEPTKKDGILNRILEQIEWMNRVPGSVEKKKPYMNSLILLRHGQSQWNLENRFTGWKDVPLTAKGIEEAIKAGLLIKENNL